MRRLLESARPSLRKVPYYGLVFLSIALLGCNPPPPPEVIAVRITQAPVMDGEIDSLWDSVPVTSVGIEGGKTGIIDVQIQAAYTDSHLYFLCRWPDDTESVVKQQWQRDGIVWTQNHEDEDRFSVLFPIGNARAQFAKNGCKRYCHDDFMATKLPNERADIWHWKAARTNPVGRVDDKYLVYATAAANDGGRRGDERDKIMKRIGELSIEAGHYVKNIDAAAAQPAFMHNRGKNIADPRFLLIEDAVPFDPESDVDTVPGYVIGPHQGSRGDIAGKGVYAKGGWTLELGRALDTGHEDDVVFELSRRYPFGIAVMNNMAGEEHSWSPKVIWLKFQTLPTPQ